ncbi:MAG: hypothetical protein ABJC39_05060 [Chloroflexota bacterium]
MKKLIKCVRECADAACRDACETTFAAEGGTAVDPKDGGKVFTAPDGGKVFITDGGKVF